MVFWRLAWHQWDARNSALSTLGLSGSCSTNLEKVLMHRNAVLHSRPAGRVSDLPSSTNAVKKTL